MRLLTNHQINPLNQGLTITAGEPAPGGASRNYFIGGDTVGVNLTFHTGDPKDGINGISNEALLVILIDRMEGFQAGAFKSRDNAIALTHLEEALLRMQKRTRDRMSRGIEGTVAI